MLASSLQSFSPPSSSSLRLVDLGSTSLPSPIFELFAPFSTAITPMLLLIFLPYFALGGSKAGGKIDWLHIDNQEASVKEDVAKITNHELTAAGIPVSATQTILSVQLMSDSCRCMPLSFVLLPE